MNISKREKLIYSILKEVESGNTNCIFRHIIKDEKYLRK